MLHPCPWTLFKPLAFASETEGWEPEDFVQREKFADRIPKYETPVTQGKKVTWRHNIGIPK